MKCDTCGGKIAGPNEFQGRVQQSRDHPANRDGCLKR